MINEKCKELIFMALGTASMCWNPRPSDQVFDSSGAIEVGNQLVDALDNELGTNDIKLLKTKISSLATKLGYVMKSINRSDADDIINEMHQISIFLY